MNTATNTATAPTHERETPATAAARILTHWRPDDAIEAAAMMEEVNRAHCAPALTFWQAVGQELRALTAAIEHERIRTNARDRATARAVASVTQSVTH